MIAQHDEVAELPLLDRAAILLVEAEARGHAGHHAQGFLSRDRFTPPEAQRASTSSEPPVQVFSDELVVREMWIVGKRAIDLVHLPRTQILIRIETPAAGEQPLAPEDLVDPWDASRELMRGIEERRVGVGQFGAKRQQLHDLVMAW